MKRFIQFFFICCFLTASLAYAHPGRTDAYGGHHNRKTGGYHYHNAGSLHDPNNPYQDHARRGLCNSVSSNESSSTGSSSSKDSKSKTSDSSDSKATSKNTVLTLQAGLKCMGYSITKIDGIMGPETQSAIEQYTREHAEELKLNDTKTYSKPTQTITPDKGPGIAENGSYYGEPSKITGKPKTVYVKGYYRKDGTYVKGHYRSKK